MDWIRICCYLQLMDSDEGVDSLAGALALLSNVDIRLRAQRLDSNQNTV